MACCCVQGCYVTEDAYIRFIYEDENIEDIEDEVEEFSFCPHCGKKL